MKRQNFKILKLYSCVIICAIVVCAKTLFAGDNATYLNGINISQEIVEFDNVQSQLLETWDEDTASKYHGARTHCIYYVKDQSYMVRHISQKLTDKITLIIRASDPGSSYVLGSKIKLPNNNVYFFAHMSVSNTNLPLSNIKSGWISFKSLAQPNKGNTEGNFLVNLENDIRIEGGFSTKPRFINFGP